MVSTRQMSTSLSSTCAGSASSDDNIAISTANRLSVMTRQASSSTVARLSASNLMSSSSMPIQQNVFLLDMPLEILDKIFSYVGYKKVGQMRVVSKQMNEVCSGILNSTFAKLITQMLNRFQTVKANMPRRESARRNHPLACECDIIETCYMRLSLLQMTFGKHIERKHCCFFPGGILDEVYNVLNYIQVTPRLERPYRVTDELFDLSTMAMEYFKDKIEPYLPEIAYFNKDFFDIPTTKCQKTFSSKSTLELSDDSSTTPPQSNMVLRKGIRKIKQGMKMYNNQLSVLRNDLRTCKRKSSEQGKQIAEQQKLLADQQKQTLEYANRLDENDKKSEEISRKFSGLLQELNKCKTELQYWRSKSPAIQTCTSCGQKITPILPAEDYQALLNQGIKPEDINMSVDDTEDGDTSNILSDSGVSTEFVFPDETTTAKLVAINTATKNLKRQHSDETTTIIPKKVESVSIMNGFVALNNVGDCSGISKRYNDMAPIKCPVAAAAVTVPTPSLHVHSDLRYPEGIFLSKDINKAATPDYNNINSFNDDAKLTSGCPTKVFYGSNKGGNNNLSESTEVSVVNKSIDSASHLNVAGIGSGSNVGVISYATSGRTQGSLVCNNIIEGQPQPLVIGSEAISTGIAGVFESAMAANVTTISGLTSNETKKARRVQKGSRCHTINSSNKRK